VNEARFTLDAASVRAARRFAAIAVSRASPDVVEVVEAIVSELAANAVRHAGTGYAVRMTIDDDRVLIEVADEGRGVPVRRAPDVFDPTGRGLQIVGALADEWGVREHPGQGKTVWATVQLDDSGALAVEAVARAVGTT